MRGYAETPEWLVDRMVGFLFEHRIPQAGDTLLDPGCGEGAFIAGVLRWCKRHDVPCPAITGVEQDPTRLQHARKRFESFGNVELVEADYLVERELKAQDYVIGNPPYVGLAQLGEFEKTDYRKRFESARGRFDLYFLFFERALKELRRGGRLAFVTPEKWLYVEAAAALRKSLSGTRIHRIDLLREDAFPGKTAYPTVTVLSMEAPLDSFPTRLRDGREVQVESACLGSSPWWGALQGETRNDFLNATSRTLTDVCERISAGIATGADSAFILKSRDISPDLLPYCRPTLSGRDFENALNVDRMPTPREAMLFPYDNSGKLLDEQELGPLGKYLSRPDIRTRLGARSCVGRKPWYAFHDSVPASISGRPKILFKDIAAEPRFWIDRTGEILPRHSVYYIIPRDDRFIDPLADWLNGDFVREWLHLNCQRAAKNYLRLQASVIKRIPLIDVPAELDPHGRLQAA